jgi:hypothetical protein
MKLGRESRPIPKQTQGLAKDRIRQDSPARVQGDEGIAVRLKQIRPRASRKVACETCSGKCTSDTRGRISISPRRTRVRARAESAVDLEVNLVEHGAVGDGRGAGPDQLDALAALPGRDSKGPGTDGRTPKLDQPGAAGAQGFGGKDRDLAQRSQGEIRRAREAQANHALGQHIHTFQIRDHGVQQRRAIGRTHQVFQGGLHVEAGKDLVVLPARPGLEVQGQAQAVARQFPGVGQTGLVADRPGIR